GRPMKTLSTDTPPEIEEILLEGYRRMPPVEKLRQVFDLNRAAQRMAAMRIQARYGPNLSERELRLRLAALWLDRETMVEAFQVLLEVTRVLEELDVPYVVGGSLASSLHGIPRSTQDADLVAALRT